MRLVRRIVGSVYALAVVVACGSNNSGSGAAPISNTGAACTDASQCYAGLHTDAGLDAGAPHGTAICLAVTGGYCTHSCAADADCCAVPGECAVAEVCSPFESTGGMDCFISCETADLSKAAFTDGDAYCAHYSGAAFICRSSGGGSNNRKVCLPN